MPHFAPMSFLGASLFYTFFGYTEMHNDDSTNAVRDLDQQAMGYLSPCRSFACTQWFGCQLVSGLLFCQWPQCKSVLPGE